MLALKALWKSRWPNFAPTEILSEDGMKLFDSGEVVMNLAFMDKLQQFRSKLGVPIIVTSGYRSQEENKKVGGKLYHPMGICADIYSPAMSLDLLFREAVDFGFTGVGKYKAHIHVDTRPVLEEGVQVLWTSNDN